ncbi:hypothetical protein CLV30_102452 [Haloactinopolyspora alba]|uniref:Uncharacterized protein n=1 Tax=Haloactinopolyspora alba TaxID=648780 RepID=A0A2P8EC65_9ACTN|nr:hypothetical protein [Haloactinopolyspora alba]PSL07063.1 hypothetical protein CLV30_102452 [Haloactinopolyspora alba]
MTREPDSPVKDENYNLVTVLQSSLKHAYELDEYIADAERDNDSELADWLRTVQHNNLRAGQMGKQLLAQRLSRDPGG